MRLSSNVIKRVSYELEDCSIYPSQSKNSELKQKKPLPPGVDREQIHNTAEQILARTQVEAEQLLQQAVARAEVIEQEAFQKGYAEGEQEAIRTGEKTRTEFCMSAAKVFQEILEIKENIYRDTEEELVELAVAIAEKLVCRQLDLMPDTILDIAKSVCSEIRDCKQVVLSVSAQQMADVVSRQGEVEAILYGTEHFAIVADAGLSPGDCRIETEKGFIEARHETMMDKLKKIIKEKD